MVIRPCPALEELQGLTDNRRVHLQKLVFTNLVNRFDTMVDQCILDNCRAEYLLNTALKPLTSQVTEADILTLFIKSNSIETVIDEIIAANPKQLEQYRAGKEKLKGFFVGQVMKAFKGQANPQQVNQLLEQKLRADTQD